MMKLEKHIIVLSTKRTGSTFLCDIISKSIEIEGRYDLFLGEYFNEILFDICFYKESGIRRFSQSYISGGHYKDYKLEDGKIKKIKYSSKSSLSNSNISARIEILLESKYRYLIKHHADKNAESIISRISNVEIIFLERRSKLLQILSYGKAINTGVWFLKDSRLRQKIERNSIYFSRRDYEDIRASIEIYEFLKSKYRNSPVVYYEEIIDSHFDVFDFLGREGIFLGNSKLFPESSLFKMGTLSVETELSYFSNASEIQRWVEEDFW